MRTIDYTQLLKIAGQVEGILAAAVGKIQTEQIARAEAWGIAACQFGLSASGNRADAVAMRRLVTAGLLESAGQTQGRAYKLTVRGWFTAAAWLGCDGAALRGLLKRVADLQAKSRITLPADSQTKLVMTWHLVPSCGTWFSGLKTPAAREKFRGEVSEVEGRLVPLIALGWICRYVSTTGAFWALMVTDAGKAALIDWTDVEIPQDMPPADSDAVYQAWSQGYERGRMLARTTSPPDSVKNTIARLLPASAWM